MKGRIAILEAAALESAALGVAGTDDAAPPPPAPDDDEATKEEAGEDANPAPETTETAPSGDAGAPGDNPAGGEGGVGLNDEEAAGAGAGGD